METTIRDVLWLMVVVSLALGWWVDHRFLTDDAAMHREQRERLGAHYLKTRADKDKEWEDFIGSEWVRLQGKSN